MENVIDEQTQVSIIFDALKQWIGQRSKLDRADYGVSIAGYMSDSRQVQADGRRARAALAEARSLRPVNLAVLLDSFRAFSGRLQWVTTDKNWSKDPCATCAARTGSPHLESCEDAGRGSRGQTQAGALEYCTGQYWPTEYRKAAASVLETYISGWKQAVAALDPPRFTFTTMDDVEAANRSIGNCWFEKSTMRFFKTRIESRLIAGHRFVTSECGPDGVRRYTIREAKPDGSIDTIGEFQAYASKRAAMVDVLKVVSK